MREYFRHLSLFNDKIHISIMIFHMSLSTNVDKRVIKNPDEDENSEKRKI